MVSLLSRDDRGIGGEHEVDTWVGRINVEGTVKTERGGDGGDNLGDEAAEVCVGGSLVAKGSSAYIVDFLK